MSARSGYQPIAQSIEEIDEGDVGEVDNSSSSQPPRGRRPGRPGSIDLKKLDTAFKRSVSVPYRNFAYTHEILRSWTESIAQKVRRRRRVDQGHERKAIWHSVFEPQIIILGGSLGFVSLFLSLNQT